MAGDQLQLEGIRIVSEIEASLQAEGFAWINHGIHPDEIDEAVYSYAVFTDELPDPSLETVEAMIPVGDDPKWLEKQLDELNYANDQESGWHKYRTNFPAFAKPGGYTNRTLQVQALEAIRGVKIDDDPKEFYHFHPGNTARMAAMHREMGWGHLPPEVHELHKTLLPIHHKAAAAVIQVYSHLEEVHPELISSHFGPKDVQASPIRLPFYHPNQGKTLAGEHFDKAMWTVQIAESHHGLWIKDPATGKIVRTSDLAATFAGAKFSDDKIGVYPESAIRPGLHGVELDAAIAADRKMHGKNVSRWAIIFFANSISAGTVLDKRITHNEVNIDLAAEEATNATHQTEAVA